MTFVKWLQTLPSTENYLFCVWAALILRVDVKNKKNCLFSFDTNKKKQQPQKDMTQYKWHPVFIGYLVFFS